jgi:hypothetical protein
LTVDNFFVANFAVLGGEEAGLANLAKVKTFVRHLGTILDGGHAEGSIGAWDEFTTAGETFIAINRVINAVVNGHDAVV